MAESENTTGTTIERLAPFTYVVLGRSWAGRAHFLSDLISLSAREACGTTLSSKACPPIGRSWKPDAVTFDPDRPGPLRAAPAWCWIAKSQVVPRSRSEFTLLPRCEGLASTILHTCCSRRDRLVGSGRGRPELGPAAFLPSLLTLLDLADPAGRLGPNL
jgi:hypothetical protein